MHTCLFLASWSHPLKMLGETQGNHEKRDERTECVLKRPETSFPLKLHVKLCPPFSFKCARCRGVDPSSLVTSSSKNRSFGVACETPDEFKRGQRSEEISNEDIRM